MPIQTAADSISNSQGSPFGFKNRIINGAMVIDQRNAGASVNNVAASGTYAIDRWRYYGTSVNKFSVQQNAGSVTPPTGFTNYLGITSLSANSPAATDEYAIQQYIEGYNIADLDWGTANAKTITLSFWVRSSLTGTFSGVAKNSAGDRSYPFSYTINQANTWEYETITIPGDTTGTWLTTNGRGIALFFNLGTGSTYLQTANAWTASFANGATGSVNILGTNGATFYITGVQLEKGTQATAFDYRDFGRELALCMRYFEKSQRLSQALASGSTTTTYADSAIGVNQVLNPHRIYNPSGGYDRYNVVNFKVPKRSDFPTVTQLGSSSGQLFICKADNSTAWVTNFGAQANMNGFQPQNEYYSASALVYLWLNWYCDAEL
jgi:hypothetical protein